MPNVVLHGVIIPQDGGMVNIYYSEDDYIWCMSTAKLDDFIEACFNEKII